MTVNEADQSSTTREMAKVREGGRVLRVLHAEAEPSDALLCKAQLEEAGLSVQADVVSSRAEFRKALRESEYDVVLTDYQLPGWSGKEVLRILAADGRDIPCILVTGTIGEEIAAECIKLGATDYVLKDGPARLPFAISGALEERREREKHKEAERKSSLLALIVESSVDAIIGAAPDGSIVNWNRGAERMFGYSAEEVYGKSLGSLFSAGADNTENSAEHYETQGVTKAGAVLELAVTISPIWNPDGLASGRSAIVRDITEDKRQQNELLTTQKLDVIGQWATGVAHDFNNLLTVINGYARMMLRNGSADSAKLEAILQAGERGQRLTRQLALVSRKQVTRLEPVNLNCLLVAFLEVLRPIIGDGIELRTSLAPNLPAVFADAGQLEQVIMNLVVNARDAMPDGGTILLATASNSAAEAADERGLVTLSVTDTGTGMSAEVQARIFEPFFTTKEAGRGTGLGLATSRGIIERSKGRLRMESTPGKGSTFTICLPAHETGAGMTQAPSAAESVVSGSGTVLLAEDDPTVRAFITALLQKGGYSVIAAEDGSKALDLCRTFEDPLYALVTDVSMPGMKGSHLAEQARVLRPNLKVLFVSGDGDQRPKEEELAGGCTAFLEKPFSGEALLKVIGEFCASAPALP
jgi:two-component system cell cycle sensor histidine kinase/response regulator CckA